jgi:hypothetical protein
MDSLNINKCQSQKSKSRYDRRPVNQYVLLLSPFGIKGVPSERISIRRQENIKAKFFILPFGWLHVKHAVQHSVLGPLIYLLYTADLPTLPESITATFAVDTAVIATGTDPTQTTNQPTYNSTLV